MRQSFSLDNLLSYKAQRVIRIFWSLLSNAESWSPAWIHSFRKGSSPDRLSSRVLFRQIAKCLSKFRFNQYNQTYFRNCHMWVKKILLIILIPFRCLKIIVFNYRSFWPTFGLTEDRQLSLDSDPDLLLSCSPRMTIRMF